MFGGLCTSTQHSHGESPHQQDKDPDLKSENTKIHISMSLWFRIKGDTIFNQLD